MFDSLHAYFVENCLNSYRAFVTRAESDVAGQSIDSRLAFNVAVALYHLREHMPASVAKSRAQLAAICPDYDLLGDVVNAGKHRDLDPKRGKAPPQINTASDICEEIVITEYIDAEGPYRHVEKRVTVQLNDGSTRDLHEIIVNVMNLWIDELSAIGAVARMAHYAYPRTTGIPRRKVSGPTAQLALEAMQGVRFKQRLRLQRYNYSTGHVEPVDLTGASGSLRIYQPKLILDLELTDHETGRVINRSVELSDEEGEVFQKLPDDQQRTSFLNDIVRQRNVLGDILGRADSPDLNTDGEATP
jgi:hypothetical protein